MIQSLEEGTVSTHVDTHTHRTPLFAVKIVELSHFHFLFSLDQFATAVRRMRTNGGVMLGLFMSSELCDSSCLQDCSELLSLKVVNVPRVKWRLRTNKSVLS